MREGWKRCRLNDVLWFQRGFDLPKDQFQNGKTPVFGSSSILGYHNISKVKAPGIITGRSGTLGKFQIAKEDFWPHNTTLWVKDFKGNDVLFCYYMLQCLDFAILNTGGAVPTLNRNLLNSFVVNRPPLPTQRKIASILSGYDDLIENNLKRIKLLEEKVQLTYEEWFVKMRFPGYETAKFDELTGLPDGWDKVKCFDAMEVLSGGTPKTTIDEYWNGEIEFYTPKDACSTAYTNGTEKKVTKIGIEKCNSKLYPKNTVFITARGTVGKVNLASQSMAMNQSCYALKGKENITQLFLYDSIKSIVGSFKSAASGGVFDTIIVDTFKFLPFILPSKNLIIDFTELVTPIYESCLIIQNQNRLLKEARDILLPRLMSGMIDVEELQIETLQTT